MLSGIYSAVFASNHQLVGSGVAIFSGNAIHGGDAAYFYKGKYKLDDDNHVSANVDVVNYTGHPSSVLGARHAYRLTLNGVVTKDGFTMSGQIAGEPTAMITIALKKVDDLVET